MKRLLVITYYWPPTGGSGVQRWVKFCKYLPEQGWQPVVYTPLNPSQLARDESLLGEIPPCVEVLKTRIFEPYELYSRLMRGVAGASGNSGGAGASSAAAPGVAGASSGADAAGASGSAGSSGVQVNSGGAGSSGNSGTAHASAFSQAEVNPVNASHKGLFKRFSLWVRGRFFIPDPRVSWVRPSVRFLLKYLKEHPVDAVVTTGPPQSMHLIGLALKRKLGVRWIADFRDPWTEIFYYKHLGLSAAADKKHRALEQSVLDEADAVIAVSPPVRDDFAAATATPVHLITNGFDPSDFEDAPAAAPAPMGSSAPTQIIPTTDANPKPGNAPAAAPAPMGSSAPKSDAAPAAAPNPRPAEATTTDAAPAPTGTPAPKPKPKAAPAAAPTTPFRLVHTGLFASDGDPTKLWTALAKLCASDPSFAARLEIRLIGKTDASIIASIQAAGLSSQLRNLGYLPHEQTTREQQHADLLILPLRREPEYAKVLPGKIFEYLAARRPILGIGQSDGAAAAILRDAGAGQMFDWDASDDELRAFITADHTISSDISRYSRRSTTGQLALLLNEITSQ